MVKGPMNKPIQDNANPLPPVELLWEMYLKISSVHRLGEKLHVSHSRVHRALVAAGYRLKGSHFSADDDEIIRGYYRNTPVDEFNLQELTVILKRPCKANVCRRARELGLSDKNRQLNASTRAGMSERAKKAIAANGHPRGMAGKKHSRRTVEAISKHSLKMWNEMSDEKKQSMILKAAKTRVRNGTPFNPRPQATWKCGWREVGGKRCYFRSRWEANYARYLQWLVENGQIKRWEFEPVTFWFEGVKRGTVSYLPDFRVTENDGREVYHEVKGWMDARSKTKIKRMAKYHPEVELIVIDSGAYRALAKKAKWFVPGWK